MFLDINKELPTADTRCRWVSPRTRWCDCIVASGLSPVNAMGSNAPAPWTPTITIKTTDDAIKFFELLRDACNQRRIAWWMHDALQEFPSPEARVAAARALEKAMRIDLLMDQNLNVALAPQGGVRLNMDTADETPAREGDAPRAPTTTPSPGLKVQLPHGTYSLNTIEAWVQVAITTALGDGSAILKGASQDPRPGTASLRVVQNIFAPRTTQAASAARKALDDIIKGFAKDCGLHEHITRALNAALVCQYYQPSTDWDNHIIIETVHKINDEYGPEHALTLTVSRLLEPAGFMQDTKRFEKFHAALVQHEHTYKVFRTDPQITTIRAVTTNARGGRGGGRGGDAGGRGGGRGGGAPGGRERTGISCTWCATYLGKIYGHDVADCKNKNKPQLLADLRAKGKLQDGGPQAPAATGGHAVCMVCLDPGHATTACGYLQGVQGLIQRHQAQFATAATNTVSATAPDGGALRNLLLSDPPLAARILRDPLGTDRADTFVPVQSKRQRGSRGHGHKGANKETMKRRRDLSDDDVITPTGDPAFHVPLVKRYKDDALSRGEEMRMCMHTHLIRAFEVFAVLAAAAHTPSHTVSANTVASTTEGSNESDESVVSEDDDTFVKGLLGLDNNFDADCNHVDKVSDEYSESPVSFAQLDSGATKSVSSRSDLFSHIRLTPDARIRVADGRELGGIIGEGPLGDSSGLPGTRAIYASDIEGTLLSQVQLVKENNLSFVHTPDVCFMQQYTPGRCPICHPNCTRRNLLVRDSKIFVPLLNTVPEHDPAYKFGKSPDKSPATADLRLVSPAAKSQPMEAETHGDSGCTDGAHDWDTLPLPRELFPPDKPGTAAAATPSAPAHSGSTTNSESPDGQVTAADTVPVRSNSTQTDSARKQYEVQQKILWHSRMPTAGCQALSALAKAFPDTFRFSPDTVLPSCHVCARARIRKAAAPPASTRLVQPLEEVHFDLFFVCGEIVLIFIDRASRYEWIYFLDKKSDLPRILQQFLIDANSAHFTVGSLNCALSSAKEKGIDAEVLNQHLSSHHLTQRVKVLYSDNAREHLSHALDAFLFDMMIDQRFSVVDSQHQNGLSENVGWNLLGPVRHDMDISNLSKGFRRACLRLNVERRACTPRAQLNWKSPFQILHPHREPPFKYFKSFGSHCTVLKTSAELQRQGKLEARGEPGIYIGTGYHLKQSGYLIWLPRLRKTVVAEHVLFDETWFPARLDKHVPNPCRALPGNTTSQRYHSDLSAADLPPTLPPSATLPLPPLHPPATILFPQPHGSVPQPVSSHGSVPQPVSSPILSPIPTSTHVTAPLTPLSQALFQNLQLHGRIQGHRGTADPDASAPITVTTPPSTAATGASEARILFDDIPAESMEARLTQHLLASERSFWKGYCKSQRPAAPPPSTPPTSTFDSVTNTTKRFALDLRTGEVIDAKGYVCAGQNVGDIASRDHLITRALIKGLKTHVKAVTNRHTVNAIALLRNPKTVREALASPEYSQWIAAIHAEMSSLIDKHTFDVCPIPHGRKVIPTKLVLRIKIGSDGRIDKFKARCCVLGFRQTKGLDFNPDNVYSPMTEPTTIRTLLAIANKLNLNVDHLDIKTAFLNGILPPDEQFFCSPPPGFPLPAGFCWQLKRGLYGAHQSGAIWSSTFRNWVKTTLPLFTEAGAERCVYVKRQHADGTMVDLEKLRDITLEPGERLIILVMNTDDLLILYTDSARTEVDAFEKLLNQSFEATPRAPVDQYLGMHVTRNRAQRLLALDGRRHVYNYIHEMGYDPASTTTVTTPLDPNLVYSQEDCPAEVDVDLRAKVWAAHGKLIHLAVWSRPDLAHAVSILGRYVHNPSQKLWLAYHRIAKYLIRTKDFRLVFGTHDPLQRTEPYGFTDSDWAADLDNRKSTGAYLFFLDGASCSWKVKLSPTVCLSTQQAEYYALSEGTKEALNLRFLLRDLGFGQTLPTMLFCDNKGAITMALHPANKPASRHIDMRIHFCRQHVELGDVATTFAPTPDMVADFMTKQTQRLTHERHCRRAFGNQHAPLPLEPIVRVLA